MRARKGLQKRLPLSPRPHLPLQNRGTTLLGAPRSALRSKPTTLQLGVHPNRADPPAARSQGVELAEF